jgi:hypothetical protein
LARECKTLPFYRLKRVSEEKAARLAERAEREAKRAAEVAEREKKRAAYERRKAAWEARVLERQRRRPEKGTWETHSSCTASTEAPVFLEMDEAEVGRVARRLKICKLQECASLDALQAAKVARKADVEVGLATALGLAKARSRSELHRGAASA